MCRDNSHHLLKYNFGICLCSMLISLSNVSNLPQNGHFSIFGLLWGPFLFPKSNQYQTFTLSYVANLAIILSRELMTNALIRLCICPDWSAFLLFACNKVSKGANIRNRYNQVPHLTQDTNGKVTNSQ